MIFNEAGLVGNFQHLIHFCAQPISYSKYQTSSILVRAPATQEKWDYTFGPGVSYHAVARDAKRILSNNGYKGKVKVAYNHKGDICLFYTWRRSVITDTVTEVGRGVGELIFYIIKMIWYLFWSIIIFSFWLYVARTYL